jgi:hypothetical protein
LIGIRPRADENLELDPLITTDSKPNEARIRYFDLQNVAYHGHDVSVIYDSDGSR